jgi:hypothetical protein
MRAPTGDIRVRRVAHVFELFRRYHDRESAVLAFFARAGTTLLTADVFDVEQVQVMGAH